MNRYDDHVMNYAWAYRTTRCVQKFDTCLNYRHPCGVNLSPCLRSVFCKLCLTGLLISMILSLSKPGRLLPKNPACQHPVFFFLTIQPVNKLSLSSLPECPACQHPVISFLIIQPVNTLSSPLNTQPVNILSSLC